MPRGRAPYVYQRICLKALGREFFGPLRLYREDGLPSKIVEQVLRVIRCPWNSARPSSSARIWPAALR